ncbi:Uu.00g124570.m01.CDS01 [Anthostomella pinea]|uniref:Uu.00g124570.m01.CDS01 n=1 Tax=Anthostomella pinea TaxID=933095 RepID=A0AAI8VHJ0_9PEZI|nr:Uu.00g124570.m01.CDS01 [Anthostomella pinea]
MAQSAMKDSSVFHGPENWESWDREFQSRTIALELWDHINPDDEEREEWPEPPQKPKYKDYPKRLDHDTRSRGTSHTLDDTAPENKRTERIDPNSHPRAVSEMTTQGRMLFNADWTVFVYEDRKYETHRKNYKEMVQWVLDNVSTHYKDTVCRPTKLLDVWYTDLKEIASVSVAQLKPAARDRYREAVKPLNKLPRDLAAWINNWEAAVAIAKEKGVGDVADSESIFSDLSRALRKVIPEWVSAFRAVNRNKLERGKMNFRLIASDLREHAAMLYGAPTSSKIAKGSFAAHFGDEADQEDQENHSEDIRSTDYHEQKQRRPQRGERPRGGGTRGNRSSSKRPQAETLTNPDRARCKACLGFHELSQCFYAVSSKAPKGWIPNETSKRLVQQRIKDDSNLAEQVSRLNKSTAPTMTE